MSDMTAPSPEEPQPVAAVVARLQERFPHLKRAADLATEPTEDNQRETPEEASQRHAARVSAYQARWDALVPPMYREAAVDALDDLQEAVRVRAWLRSGSLHLVLAGGVGTGKTYAAYAVGNQALSAGMWVEAWNVGDLMDAMRPASSDRDAERRARDCRLLILDDLTAKASDWEAERMTLLLDARVRAERQTIVTTNITSAHITETWGPRFMDRLRYRMTSAIFQGESRRGGEW